LTVRAGLHFGVMDIVKKLNPFKRVHALPAPVGSPFDSEASAGRRAGGQSQTTTAFHQLQSRSNFGRESERKRNARAAATEKELIHLNHKIVSGRLTVYR